MSHDEISHSEYLALASFTNESHNTRVLSFPSATFRKVHIEKTTKTRYLVEIYARWVFFGLILSSFFFSVK